MPAHGYQPSTASVIYNPGAAGGGLESSLASAVNIQEQRGTDQASGTSHSRSNTDTQLPSAKMMESNASTQQSGHLQQSMDLNSPGDVRVAWGSVPSKPGFMPQ